MTESYLKKSPNIWKLSNMHLKNPWVKEENKREIKGYFELNENENTIYQKSVVSH